MVWRVSLPCEMCNAVGQSRGLGWNALLEVEVAARVAALLDILPFLRRPIGFSAVIVALPSTRHVVDPGTIAIRKVSSVQNAVHSVLDPDLKSSVYPTHGREPEDPV